MALMDLGPKARGRKEVVLFIGKSLIKARCTYKEKNYKRRAKK
jgi:hypothetical protein